MLFLLILGVAAVGPMHFSKPAVAATSMPTPAQLIRDPIPRDQPRPPAPSATPEDRSPPAPQPKANNSTVPNGAQDQTPQAKAPPVKLRQVPVLIYHHLVPTRIANELTYTEMIVGTETFESQMQRLVDDGYHTISTRDLAQFIKNGAALPAKPVLITFDDGYESTYQYAFPILKRLKLQATVFVVTGWVRNAGNGFNPRRLSYLTWNQLQEMSSSGVFDVQSHTTDMHRTIKDQAVARLLPDATVLQDLVNARKQLKGHLGVEVKAFAYPYGSYNQHLIDLVKQADYETAFTVDNSRPVQVGDAPYTLHRYGVFRRHSMDAFARMLDGTYGLS